MTQRNSPFLFVVTFLTAGVFAPVWVFLMNRDVQRVDASHFPNLGWVALAALVYPVVIGLHTLATAGNLSFSIILAIRVVMVASWLAAVWLFFGGIVAVGRYVRKNGEDVPGDVWLVLLTFALCLSLPLLQRSLNALASSSVQQGAATSVVPHA